MNYQRIHDEIIADSRLSNPVGFQHINKSMGYKERHHIIPRCIGGSDDPENLVYLTARRHFIIHRLLTKIYPNNKKIWYAFSMMFANTKRTSRSKDSGWMKSVSKNYESLRVFLATSMRERIISEESRNRMSLLFKGKKLSEERKAQMRERRHSQETKNKIAEAGRNRKWSEATRIKRRNTMLLKNADKPKKEIKIKTKKIFSEEHRKKLSDAAKNRRKIKLID